MRMILFAQNNNAKKSEYKSFNGFVKRRGEEGAGVGRGETSSYAGQTASCRHGDVA